MSGVGRVSEVLDQYHNISSLFHSPAIGLPLFTVQCTNTRPCIAKCACMPILYVVYEFVNGFVGGSDTSCILRLALALMRKHIPPYQQPHPLYPTPPITNRILHPLSTLHQPDHVHLRNTSQKDTCGGGCALLSHTQTCLTSCVGIGVHRLNPVRSRRSPSWKTGRCVHGVSGSIMTGWACR